MIPPDQISAIIVTKGGDPILEPLDTLKSAGELIIYDNSRFGKDLKVYGRYHAAFNAEKDFIFVQDYDCIVDFEALAEIAVPECITVNMPLNRRSEYKGTGMALIGWGAIFHRRFLGPLGKFLQQTPFDELWLRECDRAFTYLNRNNINLVEVPFSHMVSAFRMDRMGVESRHRSDFLNMTARLKRYEACGRED